MGNLRQAAQQALEYMKSVGGIDMYPEEWAIVERLEAALAEPVQEPVAWLFTNLQSGDYDFCYQEDEHDHDREMWHKQPLYTAPPQRKPRHVSYVCPQCHWSLEEATTCPPCNGNCNQGRNCPARDNK